MNKNLFLLFETVHCRFIFIFFTYTKVHARLVRRDMVSVGAKPGGSQDQDCRVHIITDFAEPVCVVGYCQMAFELGKI